MNEDNETIIGELVEKPSKCFAVFSIGFEGIHSSDSLSKMFRNSFWPFSEICKNSLFLDASTHNFND